MKPNIVIYGLWSEELPIESALPIRSDKLQTISQKLPPIRTNVSSIDPVQYVSLLIDTAEVGKSVIVHRNFDRLDKHEIRNISKYPSWYDISGYIQYYTKKVDKYYVDVWPYLYGKYNYEDPTSSLILMLGYILCISEFWDTHSLLRVCTYVNTQSDVAEAKSLIYSILLRVRIDAEIAVYVADNISGVDSVYNTGKIKSEEDHTPLGDAKTLNNIIRANSFRTAVVFLPLPALPTQQDQCLPFIQLLTELTQDLPPVLLTKGKYNVITTEI